jgi:hypothetical protein
MPRYEYKAIAAPRRGKGGKGIKGREAKFSHALTSVLNELGADGWEYVRTDMLPMDERSGLIGHTTSEMHMMIFRRVEDEQERFDAPRAERGSAADPVRFSDDSGNRAESARAPSAERSGAAPAGAAPRVSSAARGSAGVPGAGQTPALDAARRDDDAAQPRDESSTPRS